MRFVGFSEMPPRNALLRMDDSGRWNLRRGRRSIAFGERAKELHVLFAELALVLGVRLVWPVAADG
jgi:hypothetical protein